MAGEELLDHLRHAQAGPLFDAFGQADDGDPGADVVGAVGEDLAHAVGRDAGDEDVGVVDGLLERGRRPEPAGQGVTGEVAAVLVLLVDLVDHAVEGKAELADLVARTHGDVGVVVAGGEAADAGGELAQGAEQRARQPGAGHDHHQQCHDAHDDEIALEPLHRREGLRGVDLGNQRPLDARYTHRPP